MGKKAVANGEKNRHNQRMPEQRRRPFALRICAAFIDAIDEYQAITGITDTELCRLIVTGYRDDGSAATMNRATLRTLRTWDGLGAAPNCSTILFIEGVIRLNFSPDDTEKSEILYQRCLNKAMARQGFCDEKIRPMIE